MQKESRNSQLSIKLKGAGTALTCPYHHLDHHLSSWPASLPLLVSCELLLVVVVLVLFSVIPMSSSSSSPSFSPFPSSSSIDALLLLLLPLWLICFSASAIAAAICFCSSRNSFGNLSRIWSVMTHTYAGKATSQMKRTSMHWCSEDHTSNAQSHFQTSFACLKCVKALS